MSGKKKNKTIAISVTEGRVIRDLFCNGLLEMLNERGYDLLIISPVARVPQFVETWSRPGVRFVNLPPYKLSNNDRSLLGIRRRAMNLGRTILNGWLHLENLLWKTDPGLIALLDENECCLSVITQPMFHSEIPVFLASKALNIPTLGVLRSWDNLFRGLYIRPDHLVVWNQVNRQEAVDLMMYSSDKVIPLGGVQFDPYFAPEANWSREEFSQRLNLDPTRPIITLATTGSLLPMYDENYLVDFLLKAISDGQFPGRPQLVLRLHPASKLEYFSMYQGLPDVQISYISEYIPTLAWTMTRDEVIFMANLLRHSDVVVSPGSTVTIETAIFDTPTVVPVFHTYQPELGEELYGQVFSRHFKRLAKLDLVPFVNSPDELLEAIQHALADRAWYRAQRTQLVQDYIYFTDGKSTERLADLIVKLSISSSIKH